MRCFLSLKMKPMRLIMMIEKVRRIAVQDIETKKFKGFISARNQQDAEKKAARIGCEPFGVFFSESKYNGD